MSLLDLIQQIVRDASKPKTPKEDPKPQPPSPRFDEAFKLTVGHEGGFGNDPRDRGNWTSGKINVGELKGTKYGISAMSYPKLDIARLTLNDAKMIYRNDFWDRLRCDYLPKGLDYAVFDFGVNAGIGTAAKKLQLVLGVTQDGGIGPQTLAALAKKDPHDTLRLYSAERGLHYALLDELDDIYGRGWMRRLIAVHETALAMIYS